MLVGSFACLLGLVALIDVATSDGSLTYVGFAYFLVGPAMVMAGVVVLVRLHRQWGQPANYGTGTVVYAWSRGNLIGGNLILGIGALAMLFIGLELLTWAETFAGVVALGSGLAAAVAWFKHVRRLEHQDPFFMVDDGGIEFAEGRYAWRDIERVVEATEIKGSGKYMEIHRHLAFVLRAGGNWRQAERPYDDEGVASLAPFGFVLEITHCRKKAKAALAAFGRAPVKGELSELLSAATTRELSFEPQVQPAPPDVEPAGTQTPGEPAPWPPPLLRKPSSRPETEAASAAARDKRGVRGIWRVVLVVLGVGMVLFGGLSVIGFVGEMASPTEETTIGATVGALLFSLALLIGGGFMTYRLVRRRKPSGATELPVPGGNPGG